jgi:hypothetical protein
MSKAKGAPLFCPYEEISNALYEDALPADLPKNFDLEQYIVPTRLTDATEDGGLFGIRFGRGKVVFC